MTRPVQVASPPTHAPVEPEPLPPPPEAGDCHGNPRETFDHFVALEYPGLLAEVTILLDDPTRAARQLMRALAATWSDWDRVRDDPDPADRVRDRVLGRLDHGARAGRGRATSAERPLTLTALAGLPTVQRQALVLHHVLGRPVEKVAADTGSSAAAVRQRLCHGAWALANHHPHVHTIPLPQAAPRPRPDTRTRVITDVLDRWAATELEMLRETMRLELATRTQRSVSVRARRHDQRRLAMIAVGAAGAIALLGLSVHVATEGPTPLPAPGPEGGSAASAPPAGRSSGGPGVDTDPTARAAVPPPAVPQPAVPEPAPPQPAVPQPAVPQPAPPRPAASRTAAPPAGGGTRQAPTIPRSRAPRQPAARPQAPSASR